MLYWKDDIDLDYYKFYRDARYKLTRELNLNRKKTPYTILRWRWDLCVIHLMKKHGGILTGHIPILLQSPTEGFSENKECQKAFDNLKEYLCTPPLLTKPQSGEKLYIYLLTSEEAGAKPKYHPIGKLALALIVATRKMRPYFQSHQVTVLTNQPLKHILASPNASGRMIKWVMQLSDHGIEFEPRPAIKAQVLANSISKVTKIENDMQS
ncbi:UNVERIFIED_CONTAM: hypothetical protein Sangu_1704700 [Sesamum angustifolium]|uniref:Reverse transcriptase RNase H-like domain-containing protein n=1 Tax=Sesamum angustifolium TaxID=2727405 RepID=A0AAW2MJB3_9LAMI